MKPSTKYIAGHVDAGKSTLMGHLLYQLGNVNKRLMHKYEQESKKVGKSSFAYAWVLDETEEERFVDIIAKITGLQIFVELGSLSHDFKIWPITFQGSGPS